MEIFDNEIVHDETFGIDYNDNKFYKPSLKTNEYLRMEDITSPYRSP
jgi:hypothetical protein